MRKLLLIYTFIHLMVPGVCSANNPTDYYILHDTKRMFEYIPRHETELIQVWKQGFKELCNPNDSVVVCGNDRCSAGNHITFPPVELEAPLPGPTPPDYSKFQKFRVFVPPGTTALNLTLKTKPGTDVKAAVRMNYVPDASQPAALSYTTPGTFELRYLDYAQVNLKASTSSLSVYNSTPYPLEHSINPLAESHSGWVYVDIFSGAQNIEAINYTFTVNTIVYTNWFSTYYQSRDVYGLDDQSILPAIVALAGSQLLQGYGIQLTETVLKELGLKFQDSAGQQVQSALSTGQASMIPFGCCKFFCCFGIGLMATPTGVSMAFNYFADSTIPRLDDLFISANESYYQWWGLPIPQEFYKNRQAFSKLVENQDQVFHQLFTGLGMAQAELKNQKQLGKDSVFSSIHLGEDIAKAVQINKTAQPQLTEKIYDDLTTYRNQFANPDKVIDHHLKKSGDTLTGQTLLSPSGTLDPDQMNKAKQMTELLLDPYPALKLPPAAEQTPAGKKYQYLRRVNDAQLLVSQQILSENISLQAPTVSAELVNKILASMGSKQEPLPEGERMSSKAFMQLYMDSKSANPNWLAEPADKWLVAIAREKLILKAFALEQEFFALQQFERQTLQKAQAFAARVNLKMHPDLNLAYINATQPR